MDAETGPRLRQHSDARRIVLATVAALAMFAPGVAVAQDPFGGLPASPPDQSAPPVRAPTRGNDQEGLSAATQAAIVIGGILALLAIGVFIARDARRRAPVDEAEPEVVKADGQARERQHAKARSRAKAARAQRKRNR